MPFIKKIKILKSKVSITLDNKKKIELDKNIYPNFYLYEGKEISNKELREIQNYNQSASLMNYAFKLREKSLYSEFKMREKLYTKGGDKKSVDYVIKTMKSHDLLDDDAFILEHVEYYNSLHYGKNKIISKLQEKGIFEEKTSKIKFPISIEKKKAQNLLPKLEKKYEKYNNSQKKQHIYNAYLTQGFDYDIAKEMVDSVKISSNKEENNKLEKDFNKAYSRYKDKYNKKEIKSKLINFLASKGYKIGDIINMIERKHL